MGSLSPKQLYAIANSDQRVNIWEGSISSGKTFSSILRWLTFVAEAPENGELVMIGKNRDSIYRNVFAPIENEPALNFLADQVQYRSGAPHGTMLGRRVHVIGANDNRAENKIRGMTVAGAYCDELTVLPRDFFKQLDGRMRVRGAKLFATTNPDGPQHWLKTEFLDKMNRIGKDGKPELSNWRRFHFVMEDNPSLEQSYIDYQKATYTGLWYQRFILGEWVSADGAVYDMWNQDRHMVKFSALPEMQYHLGVGVDHGTTNPTSAILVGMGLDGVLYAIDEWRHESSNAEARWSNVQLSKGLRDWLITDHHPTQVGDRKLSLGHVIVDTSAADFRIQLKDDGLVNYPADKSDVSYGIRTIASLLATDRFKVSDRCWGLLKEIPAYSWSTKATEDGKDQVKKDNDHSLDALRYAIVTTEKRWRKHLTMTVPDTDAAA
ncbi:PBSX family phage terminase large subunit [Rhodococcus hoagii]|nr:PBSX family phage terminase large subunit [Prescottella equi]